MRLSVVTDEISEDLGHVLDVCAELGIGTVELRSVDGRNIVEHAPGAVRAVHDRLASRGVAVCAIASPFLKCDRDADEAEMWRPFERSLAVARELGAPLVRAFSFWRVEQPADVREQLVSVLGRAAGAASAAGMRLVIENEYSCNAATGEESAAVVRACAPAEVGVIWDPANEGRFLGGRSPGLGGYGAVRDHVEHVHVKDVDRDGEWVPIGDGVVDHAGLLRALERDGYRGCVSVETHHRVDGSAELATRACVERLRESARRTGVGMG